MQSELVWDAGCRLGEGPVWHPQDASIYFVDIKGREVLRWSTDAGSGRRWPMPQQTGWLVPRRRGGWLAGFQQGVAALELEPEVRHALLHRLHDEGSPMRLNDAKADARGRLWFGSMNDDDSERSDGLLYRLTGDGTPEAVDRGYRVTNGPAFSPDGRTMYHNDTAARRIHAFDVSAEGALSNKRVWAEFNRYEGHPDGIATDAEGRVWVAHWGGSRVTQRDARSGRVLRTVVVPAPNVTSVAFGGPGLVDLYITTARSGVGESALAQSPLSGGLFVARGVGPGRLAEAFDG